MTLRESLPIMRGDRFEEELTQPRGEIWPDGWSGWDAIHREAQGTFACYADGRATPFCPTGYP